MLPSLLAATAGGGAGGAGGGVGVTQLWQSATRRCKRALVERVIADVGVKWACVSSA